MHVCVHVHACMHAADIGCAISQPNTLLEPEVKQLDILHSDFLKKWKECTKQVDICQMFKKASKCHRNSPIILKGPDSHEKAGAGRQWGGIHRKRRGTGIVT